ncbi:MAG TPA: DUF3482 domain-containing protein [Usitatibacter sp.]|nr:DUF3482 domain-containing protein [Usitatibacter sp.]
MNVDITLAAHTNVGKTTLMRTLLRRDIGEIADRPHVTENAERHTLLQTPEGDALHLWDTPGFGDSARLLKRLRMSGNPIGWLQTQVWDRFVDRPFFCSQEAVRAVRESSDLVLYLVNASEDPAATAYVEAELEILRWIGKPVLLLLNQAGRPSGRAAAAAEEQRWQQRLAAYVPAGSVLTLDAFARCWVQEDRLLELAGPLLPMEKRPGFAALRAAWRERNLAVFHESVGAMANAVAETAVDHEPIPEGAGIGASLASAARKLVSKEADTPDPATQAAVDAVARRLRERERALADRLIALHGLDGRARERILSNIAAAVEVSRPTDVKAAGAVGGLVGGALTGLATDLATGGLTLGLGALVGGIVGALGLGGAAAAYNSAMGLERGAVRWMPALLRERVAAVLLLYLAVAHYGRGRGAWIDEEAPAHWAQAVADSLRLREAALDAIWERGRSEMASGVHARLELELAEATRDALVRLYPECVSLWEHTAPGAASVTEPS